jgi:hypothetical protein
MKRKHLKTTIYLLLPVFILAAIASCSEEIVPITIQERTALDSLELEIGILSDDLVAAQIAKDSLTRRQEALQKTFDSLNLINSALPQVVQYTVQVMDGSQGYINTRVAGLSGAVVTVSQGNVAQEVTTDGTGFATFPELDDGFISVTIEITDFSDVFMVVDLRDGGVDGSGSPDVRYASSQVMVFPTSGSSMFTLTGTSYYNQDLNNVRADTQNDPAHPFQFLDIYETVPTGTSFLIDCTPLSIPNKTIGRPGFIVTAVYAGLQRIGTSDASGNWTVTLPVVLITDGSNLFTYTGPKEGDQIRGTQINVAPTANTEEVWTPSLFYPSFGLGNIQIFPGGNSVQDLYYFTL